MQPVAIPYPQCASKLYPHRRIQQSEPRPQWTLVGSAWVCCSCHSDKCWLQNGIHPTAVCEQTGDEDEDITDLWVCVNLVFRDQTYLWMDLCWFLSRERHMLSSAAHPTNAPTVWMCHHLEGIICPRYNDTETYGISHRMKLYTYMQCVWKKYYSHLCSTHSFCSVFLMI